MHGGAVLVHEDDVVFPVQRHHGGCARMARDLAQSDAAVGQLDVPVLQTDDLAVKDDLAVDVFFNQILFVHGICLLLVHRIGRAEALSVRNHFDMDEQNSCNSRKDDRTAACRRRLTKDVAAV